MKVAIFSTHVLWNPHYATELELVEQYLRDGSEVDHFVCDGELDPCDQIAENHIYTQRDPLNKAASGVCNACVKKRRFGQGLLQLSWRYRQQSLTSLNQSATKHIAPAFVYESCDDLIALTYETYDVGAAVLSSLISFTRESEPDIPTYRNLIDRHLKQCVQIFSTAKTIFLEHRYDRIHVFNGRYTYTRALFRAAEAIGTTCLMHERGSTLGRYALFENALPHNLDAMSRKILATWESADPAERVSLGTEFFETRAAGKAQNWYSFVSNQVKSLNLEDKLAGAKSICVFTSSEDEFRAIGPEWQNAIYASQSEGVARLVSDFSKTNPGGYWLVIRIHPNDVKSRLLDVAQRFASAPNVIFVAPDAQVSTYGLLRNADKVITYGSTMGIEAVYHGKPSILAGGKAFYMQLGAVMQPASHDELMKLIYLDLAVPDKTAAYQYGYYMMTYGEKYRAYVPTGVESGLYKGVNLDRPDDYDSALQRIKGILQHAIATR